jgi:hypothetical protein
MSAVNDAVEDGVTESRIADVSVPFVHRELAGDAREALTGCGKTLETPCLFWG